MKGADATGQGKALAWRVEDINRQALTWIDSLPAAPRPPLFLHLQYMEPHAPYQPPADLLAARFGDQVLELAGLNFTALYGVRQPDFDIHAVAQLPPGYSPPTAETLAAVTALYDIAVRSVDRGIRALFADLEARGVLKHALVIVTSDHGEQFLEHGGMGHKRSLYNEEIQVPLLVLTPGQTQRVDIEEPVGLIDVAPTVLAWVGVPPPAAFEGRVLPGAAPPDHRPAASPPARPVFSELLPGNVERAVSPHQRAAVSAGEKLILRVDGSSEFYDLARDPGERERNVSPAAGAALRAQVQDFRRVMTRAAPAESKPLDAQTTERLRALGYDP
jgi:arylsulfatase A-like enzyme